jgi:putative transcriptional regulator
VVTVRDRVVRRAGLLLALLLVATSLAADPRPQRGMFLLATPKVQHPMWKETVILLLEHGPGGTLGLILNRPLELPLDELADRFPGIDAQELGVYIGGPVGRHQMIWLLRSPRVPDGAREVVEGVSYGSDPEMLLERLRAGSAESELRLVLGRAGWAPGQLAGEIARGDWRVLPADAASVFDIDSERQWRQLMQRREQRWVGTGSAPPAG